MPISPTPVLSMPALFRRLFGHRSLAPESRVYAQIVAQARRPWLYTRLEVPDTLDGRFDMLVLHAFLVFDRLRRGDERAHAFSQAVFDEMFRDLDHNLREMGVGDLSVGKRIRKMGEIFYGRSAAYETALQDAADADPPALAEALARNVFAGSGRPGSAQALASYMLRQRRHLSEQSIAGILGGEVRFEDADGTEDDK